MSNELRDPVDQPDLLDRKAEPYGEESGSVEENGANPWRAYTDDQGRRLFVTASGVELDLGEGVPPLILTRFFLQLEKHEPKPPVIVVKVAKRQELTVNYNDPGYQAALKAYEDFQNVQMIAFLSAYVKTEPPKSFEIPPGIECNGKSERKAIWIETLIHDPDEINDFMNAVMGVTQATSEGIADAEDSFRPENK